MITASTEERAHVRRETALTRPAALGLATVALLAVVAYITTPLNFWVGDDYNYIVPKGIDRVIAFFDPTVPSRAFYRPLNWTTWAIDYALWGKWHPGWHFTSIFFYTLVTLTVTLIVQRLFRAWPLALFTGALFAVHPTHTEAVTFIGGRADLVCALFYFPAVLFFVIYLQRRAEGKPSTLYYVLSLAAMAGAILGKEMGVTVPLVLLLTDLFFFTRPITPCDIRYWRDRLLPHLPFFALVGAYAFMRWYLVEAKIVTNTYVGPSLWDAQRLLDSTASNILLFLGVWGAPTAVGGLPNALKVAIVLAAAAAIVLLVRWLGRPGLCALLWSALTLLPTINLTALRWLFIPSFGVCLLAALAAWKMVERAPAAQPRARQAGYALVALVALVWGAGTLYQNVMWYRAGEEARAILTQIKEQLPQPANGTTIYFAGAPYSHDTALLFNTGLAAAMLLIYPEGAVELHEVEQLTPTADPVIVDALADPPRIRPNSVFMGYHEGKVYRYGSFQELVAAGIGKE